MLEFVLLLLALIIVASHPALLAIAILLGFSLAFIRFVLRIWTNGFRWGFRTACVILVLLIFFI